MSANVGSSVSTIPFGPDGLGADPTGETLSDNALTSIKALSGDVVVSVPIGRYRFSADTHHITGSDLNSLSLVAPESGVPDDSAIDETLDRPLFVAPDEFDGVWLDIEVPSFTMEGIAIDRAGFETGPQIHLHPRQQATLTDVRIYGRDDSDAVDGSLFTIETPHRGSVTMEGVRAPNGAWWSPATAFDSGPEAGRTGVYAGAAHEGSLTLRDCEFGEFASYGVDTHETAGTVTIEGGRYFDSGRGQLRVGGMGADDDGEPQTTISGTTVNVDLAAAAETHRRQRDSRVVFGLDPDSFPEVRGIVVDRPLLSDATPPSDGSADILRYPRTTVAIERADVRVESFDNRSEDIPPIALPAAVWGTARAPTLTLTDSDVRVNATVAIPPEATRSERRGVGGVHVATPGEESTTQEGAVPSVVLRRTVVGGVAQTGVSVGIPDRPDSVIEGCCIERPDGRVALDISDVVETERTRFANDCPRR